MALHQGLEAELDVGRGGLRLEPEDVERLALGVVDDPGLAPPQVLAVSRGAGAAEMAEQLHRVVDTLQVGPEPRRRRARGRLAAVHAHLPGRTMADHRVLLVA